MCIREDFKEVEVNNKVEITLNGKKVMLDIDRAIELGLIEEVKKELIDRVPQEKVYWHLDSISNVTHTDDWRVEADNNRYANGNYFSCGNVVQEKINQLGGINGRIQAYILEENEKANWVARWDDGEQEKYFIYYDNLDNLYEFDVSYNNKFVGAVYTSLEIAEELVDKLNNNYR